MLGGRGKEDESEKKTLTYEEYTHLTVCRTTVTFAQCNGILVRVIARKASVGPQLKPKDTLITCKQIHRQVNSP